MAEIFRQTTVDLIDIDSRRAVQDNWHFLIGLGVFLIILGLASISVAVLTTLISVIVFGAFLLINGGILIYQAFKVWWHNWSKFILHVLIGILYAIGGIIFIVRPLHGAISLTLFLALLYIFLGFYRGTMAVVYRTPGRGWLLFNAAITLILGILILLQWPAASLWVIGLFVGIDIIFTGWAFIMSALAVRTVVKPA